MRYKTFGVAVLHSDAERVATRQHRGAHRDAAHGFHTPGHDDVVRAGKDALSREADRLLAAAALAVDGGARNRLREARAQQRVARDVYGLITHLGHGSGDDVVYLSRVHAGVRNQLAQTVRQQVSRQNAVQRAIGFALADGRAYRTHDDGVAILICHDSSLSPELSITRYTQI